MTDPAELIARLEAVTGGGRGLDAEIAIFLGRGTITGHYPVDPHYTTSLDAAFTLIPKGRRRVLSEEDWGDSFGWACDLHSLSEMEPEFGGSQVLLPKHILGEAPTPALAVCIAALKARSA